MTENEISQWLVSSPIGIIILGAIGTAIVGFLRWLIPIVLRRMLGQSIRDWLIDASAKVLIYLAKPAIRGFVKLHVQNNMHQIQSFLLLQALKLIVGLFLITWSLMSNLIIVNLGLFDHRVPLLVISVVILFIAARMVITCFAAVLLSLTFDIQEKLNEARLKIESEKASAQNH